MNMLKAVPYDAIKKNQRAYDIMLLREQQGKTLAAIAKEYGVSPNRIREIYNRQKRKQARLYIVRIGAGPWEGNRRVDRKGLRAGPGLLSGPGLRLRLSGKGVRGHFNPLPPGGAGGFSGTDTVPAAPKAPDGPGDGGPDCGDAGGGERVLCPDCPALDITRAKARHTYDWYYRQRAMELIQPLMDQARTQEERWEIWNRYLRGSASPKRRYEMLAKELEEE